MNEMNVLKKMKKGSFSLLLSLMSLSAFGQLGPMDQVINPAGGFTYTDGLKMILRGDGRINVYRNNKVQNFYGHDFPHPGSAWVNASDNMRGVALYFQFSLPGEGLYSSTLPDNKIADEWKPSIPSHMTLSTCSTTPAQQSGNTWTASVSGWIKSPLTGYSYFVTVNLTYTHPNNYFAVDYFVRAPSSMAKQETVHLYLTESVHVSGSPAGRAYVKDTSGGQIVGMYRNNTDTNTGCNVSDPVSDPRSPVHHGFKIPGGFRSYYSGFPIQRDILASSNDNKLQNTVSTSCGASGIAVEFTIGPLNAGQVGAKRILYFYGDIMGEFDSHVVTNPTVNPGSNSAVTVNFTSDSYFSEKEGDNTHLASNIKIVVSEGNLAQDQICNFTLSNNTAQQGTHYSYVRGFVIPAGNYTIPKTLTLNNVWIIGNTECGGDRDFEIAIEDQGSCNNLVVRGNNNRKMVVIQDDDALSPGKISATNTTTCYNTRPGTINSASLPSGGSHTLQWQSSTNLNNWDDISNETGNSYTPGNLMTTTYYRRAAKSTTCGTSYSDTVRITVLPELSGGTISSSANKTICKNTSPGAIGLSTPFSGGTGNYSYQWKYNTTGSSGTWVNVVGGSGAQTDTYTPGNLPETTYFRLEVNNGTCGTVYTTNMATITVGSALSAGTISGAHEICSGAQPQTLTSASLASGGNGEYVYQWQSSPDNSTWTNVGSSGIDNTSYTPGALSQTTYFRRGVTACGTTEYTASVKVMVNAFSSPTVTVSASPAFEVCEDDQRIEFTATVVTQGGSVSTYTWMVDGVTKSSGATADKFTLTDLHLYRQSTVTCSVRVTGITCGSGDVTISDGKGIRVSSCTIPVNPHMRGKVF